MCVCICACVLHACVCTCVCMCVCVHVCVCLFLLKADGAWLTNQKVFSVVKVPSCERNHGECNHGSITYCCLGEVIQVHLYGSLGAGCVVYWLVAINGSIGLLPLMVLLDSSCNMAAACIGGCALVQVVVRLYRWLCACIGGCALVQVVVRLYKWLCACTGN